MYVHRLFGRALAALALLAAFLLLAAAPASADLGDVPTPIVKQLPITPDSAPFGAIADPAELADRGYVEEEFTIEGGAFKYDTPAGADGSKILDGPNGDGSWPYKTRILVRRPANAADFNGNVVVEWLNVTGGFDLDYAWGLGGDTLMEDGYAWVAVSAQRVGINFLEGWFKDPTRYADLSPADPGAASNTESDRASYDIYSQVAKSILGAGTGPKPLAGLNATDLVASGASQSGGRLNRYYDSIQNLHGLYTSFLPTVSNGTLRDDLDAKVLRLLSERETRGGPSSEVDNGSYRRWEVAGSSHAPEEVGRYWEPLNGRDLVPILFNCNQPPLSAVPYGEVWIAALEALLAWQDGGPAPPAAPRMSYDVGGGLVRDRHDIGRGGIRLPEVEVPVATGTPFNDAPAGADPFSAGFCRLLGANIPFRDGQLNSIYADHGDYLDQYAAAADAVLADDFITPEGAERLKADASAFPRLRPEAPELERAGRARAASSAQQLVWRGSTAPETTFELQHQAKDRPWEIVDPALPKPSFKLKKEKQEGTYRYKVRGSTDVPEQSYREFSGKVITTPFSSKLTKVKIDRSGPRRPSVKLIGKRRNGAFVGEVKVKVIGRADPKLRDGSKSSGLDKGSVPKTKTLKGKGSYKLKARTRDLAGNKSKPRTVKFTIR